MVKNMNSNGHGMNRLARIRLTGVVAVVVAVLALALGMPWQPVAAQEAQENSPPNGGPYITGRAAQVGQVVTASVSGIRDADGLTNAIFSYQWLADDTAIEGATSSTYTIQSSDAGKKLKVRVTFTDDAGNNESPTSSATKPVDIPATGAPTISGTAREGEVLTASTTGISDSSGLTNVSYRYQWLANDREIYGARGSTYSIHYGRFGGQKIKVRVTFTDDAGTPESLTSAETAAVDKAAQNYPTISGTAQVGQTLTASTDRIYDISGLTNVSYSYQWTADRTEIDGATSSTYTIQSSDNGKVIRVRVDFQDDAGHDESLTSPGTAEVVLGGL